MHRATPREYAAYGLRVRSALALPFLPAAADGCRPDVEVGFGETPAALPVPWRGRHHPWQAVPGSFLFTVPEVVRYFATTARVVIERADADDSTIAGFVAKQVLSAVLQQRGTVVLHASAVADERGAMVFLGAPGSGKSTLLAALANRGYLAVADDVLGMGISGGLPVALPGLPEVRLWQDSRRALGLLSRPMQRVAPGSEKRRLRPDRLAVFPTPVRAFYVLDAAAENGVQFRPEAPSTARDLLDGHRYRRAYGLMLGTRSAQLKKLDVAVAATRTFRVLRPDAAPLDATVEDLTDRVEAHWAMVTGRTLRRRPGCSQRPPATTPHPDRTVP